MSKEICIHGHFYQPPRENPWLGEVETQDSAYPYHDWNDRISAECYAPNSASRILDSENRIVRILNNYSKISFDFGPTLLEWLERKRPRLYRSILEADRMSRERFGGHGAALAQAHSHMILPLADRRDKRTQILWGIRDFLHRFARFPEGMWLPETAVDLETLDLMAEAGIAFTILAPRQARRVRRIGADRWEEVAGGRIDPRRPYLCRLPSGRTISLFFYEGAVSRDVAFGELLRKGELFAQRLFEAFGSDEADSRLVHIATDGETYGHHHRFGEMALSYCLHAVEERGDARLTVFGDYLERNSPRYEAEVVENSSWSCVHGVERWRDDCGCQSGGRPGWNQKWRGPLREALDGLRARLAEDYESGLGGLVEDPWAVRDDYIAVILDRSRASLEAFLKRHSLEGQSPRERIRLLKRMEAQRCAQFMYTSCGWFFSEISGIETVQILRYAARAMQLLRELDGGDFEPEFLSVLRRAPSNNPRYRNGAGIYTELVRPGILDLFQVGVHASISSLFPQGDNGEELPAFSIRTDSRLSVSRGRMRLAVGSTGIRSRITGENLRAGFGILHFGDQNLIAGVRARLRNKDLELAGKELKAGFDSGDMPAVIGVLERRFGRPHFTLGSLFRDRKRRVMGNLLSASLKDSDTALHPILEQQYPLLRSAREMAIPLPWAQSVLVEFALTMRLRRLLETEGPDLDEVERIADEIQAWEFTADKPALKLIYAGILSGRMEDFSLHPESLDRLAALTRLTSLLTRLDPDLNLWESQNLFDRVTSRHLSEMRERAERGDGRAARWLSEIRALGGHLKIRVD